MTHTLSHDTTPRAGAVRGARHVGICCDHVRRRSLLCLMARKRAGSARTQHSAAAISAAPAAYSPPHRQQDCAGRTDKRRRFVSLQFSLTFKGFLPAVVATQARTNEELLNNVSRCISN